jgi:hypothetical protein
MKRFSLKNASVPRHALCLLCISFSVILLELFLITLSLFCGGYPTRLYATRLYRAMVEYIMLDITIAVIGSFLLDLVIRERGRN